jgi:amidophosphoribosyltransferase
VIVDDSIVRGTTAMARVESLRESGAKEVHLRVSCPPHKHACHYGIDFPDPKKLIANQHTTEAIAGYLGADSIGYLSVPGMVKATGLPKENFCLACFDGNYPVAVPEGANKEVMVKQRKSLAPEVSPQTELFGKLK